MSIHNENYREYLLRYLEGELSTVEKQDAERYMLTHEEAAAEWGMLKKTRMLADSTIVFPNKALLMRKEEDEEAAAAPVLQMHNNWKIAGRAAAAIILFGVGLGVYTYQNQKNPRVTASTGIEKPKPGGNIKTNISPSGVKSENLSADKDAYTPAPAAVKIKKGGERIKNEPKPETERFVLIQNKPEKRDSGNLEDYNHGGCLFAAEVERSNARTIDLGINTTDNSLAQTLPIDAKWNPVHKKAGKNKTSSSGILFAMGGDGLMKVVDGLKSIVNIKKKTIDNKTYYALVVDAGNLHIDKTLISTDH